MTCAALDCRNTFTPYHGRHIYCSNACCCRVRYHENIEQYRASTLRYAAANREHKRVTSLAWRKANPERHRAYSKKWYRANKDRARQQLTRRRAVLAGAEGMVTSLEWYCLKLAWGFRCAYCGLKKPLTQDHDIPLSRGGQHTIDNIIPACRSCNSSKNNKTREEYIHG